MLSHYLKNALACLIAVMGSALLLEAGLLASAERGWIEIDYNPVNGFWADISPDFGVWHRSNASYTHEKSCFRVTYATNSYGAVDQERNEQAVGSRVAVLGDSMMEGYTLKTPDRLSNRLERMTGIEHLNFATSQTFGPVQYLLIYETLAKRFAHDVVLVGFLPENDFTDSNWEIGQKAFYNRYRPYFVGSDGTYELVHFNKAYFDPPRADGDWLAYLWNDTMTFRAIRRAYAVHRYRTVVDNQVVQWADLLVKGVRSFYYDYNQADQAITRYTLDRLVRAADGRPVVILTIPMLKDLQNLRHRGQPPLPAWFGDMSRQLGFTYVDLLPVLAAHPSDWNSYYHECDNHWTSKANAVVAEALAPVMREAVSTAQREMQKASKAGK